MVVFANGDLSTLYERRMQRFLSWDFSICAVLLSSEDETCLQHCVYGWQPLLTLSDTIENLSEQVPFLLVLVCMLMRHNLHVKIVYQLFSTLSMPTYAMWNELRVGWRCLQMIVPYDAVTVFFRLFLNYQFLKPLFFRCKGSVMLRQDRIRLVRSLRCDQ